MAKKEAEAAKKEAKKTRAAEKVSSMIPKPKISEMSEGTDRLRRAMGLIDDKLTYLAIQVSVVLKNK